jgi:hypothetical protein
VQQYANNRISFHLTVHFVVRSWFTEFNDAVAFAGQMVGRLEAIEVGVNSFIQLHNFIENA